MKICVLNGSPKGPMSTTLKFVQYLRENFPENEFDIFDIAQSIKIIERDENEFRSIMNNIAGAQAVLWAFPVYYFLVPSQMKRFIELIFERNGQAAFHGKPGASLTTSLHISDHTAHDYMHGICDDLDMNYMGYYSADLDDLSVEKEQSRLLAFGKYFLSLAHDNLPHMKHHKPIKIHNVTYNQKKIDPISIPGKKILIVADDLDRNSNLKKMVFDLQDAFNPQAEIMQLKDIQIRGGCRGCVKCAENNHCIYEGRDEFVNFIKNSIRKADILFFAGAIKDRYLSAQWKCYFDRCLFMGHVPTLEGKQLGYIVAGPLKQIHHHMNEIFVTYTSLNHANMIGIVSDDTDHEDEINSSLKSIAVRAAVASQLNYIQPDTYLKIGVTKHFRDIMLGGFRHIFLADDKYYKIHGYYDIATRKYKE